MTFVNLSSRKCHNRFLHAFRFCLPNSRSPRLPLPPPAALTAKSLLMPFFVGHISLFLALSHSLYTKFFMKMWSSLILFADRATLPGTLWPAQIKVVSVCAVCVCVWLCVCVCVCFALPEKKLQSANYRKIILYAFNTHSKPQYMYQIKERITLALSLFHGFFTFFTHALFHCVLLPAAVYVDWA